MARKVGFFTKVNRIIVFVAMPPIENTNATHRQMNVDNSNVTSELMFVAVVEFILHFQIDTKRFLGNNCYL